MAAFDVPRELNEWWKVFTSLAYRHQYSQVFDDFLTIMMNWYAPPNSMIKERDQAMSKYSKEEHAQFNELFRSFHLVFQKAVDRPNYTPEDKDKDGFETGAPWRDLLGDIYMSIAGSGKQSAMGQFFTPEPICTMMAHMTVREDAIPVDKIGNMLHVNDCACGSARTLLAFNSVAPGNFLHGEDLDLMCCKMACINMMMHGCEGFVIQRDTLAMDWRRGWQINPLIRKIPNFPIPSIHPISHNQWRWEMDRMIEKSANRKTEIANMKKNKDGLDVITLMSVLPGMIK
jgi:type I restriction enzyme M protein